MDPRTRTRSVRRVALAVVAGLVAALTASVAPATAAPFADATTRAVEERLAALRYDVGPVDGMFDAPAASAVVAFQKVHGLPASGQLDPPTVDAVMSTFSPPPPLVPAGGPERVEVDLRRQVLFLYRQGGLFATLPISSGKDVTPTPTGAFRFYRYDPGWHTSRLGRLYNAVYFFGGYAIHGSLSVPPYPASHGCIRIPMHSAEWFPSQLSTATAVYILPR